MQDPLTFVPQPKMSHSPKVDDGVEHFLKTS